MKNDHSTTIQEIRDALLKFRDERDWKQFHKPKDLALAMVIEAGELGELFLWKSDEEIEQLLQDAHKRRAVEAELADVILYALNFANATDIDVASICMNKIAQNAEKYPVDKAEGNARKYTEF